MFVALLSCKVLKNRNMRYILIVVVFLSIISYGNNIGKLIVMDKNNNINLLHTPNKEQFEAIVQFVLDNGWDAFLSKDDRLTPMVEYKDLLVYIIPMSTQLLELIQELSL